MLTVLTQCRHPAAYSLNTACYANCFKTIEPEQNEIVVLPEASEPDWIAFRTRR